MAIPITAVPMHPIIPLINDGPGGSSDNVFEGVDFSDDDIALYDVYGAWKAFGTEQEQPSAEIYQTVLGKLNVDADCILYRFEDGEAQSEIYMAALDEQKRFAVEAGLSQGKYKRMIFTAEKARQNRGSAFGHADL